jgi:hypothetical protein
MLPRQKGAKKRAQQAQQQIQRQVQTIQQRTAQRGRLLFLMPYPPDICPNCHSGDLQRGSIECNLQFTGNKPIGTVLEIVVCRDCRNLVGNLNIFLKIPEGLQDKLNIKVALSDFENVVFRNQSFETWVLLDDNEEAMRWQDYLEEVKDSQVNAATKTMVKPVTTTMVNSATPMKAAVLPNYNKPLDVFVHYDEQTLRRFFAAAEQFFALEPWQRLNEERALGFQVAGGAWHYANIAGQSGEGFGLGIFLDWLEYCAVFHSHEPKPHKNSAMQIFRSAFQQVLGTQNSINEQDIVAAIGGLERFTVGPASKLSADDLVYLQRLGLGTIWHEQYPIIERRGVTTLEPTRLDLSVYSAVLEALNQRLSSSKSANIGSIKASFKANEGSVALRYPSAGDETATTDHFYRLSLLTRDFSDGNEVQITIEVAGEVKCDVLFKQVNDFVNDYGVIGIINILRDQQLFFWRQTQFSAKAVPSIEQLADSFATGSNLVIHFGMIDKVSIQFTAIERPLDASTKIEATVVTTTTPRTQPNIIDILGLNKQVMPTPTPAPTITPKQKGKKK